MEKQQVSEKKIVSSFVFSAFVAGSAIETIAIVAFAYFAKELNFDSLLGSIFIGTINLIAIWVGVIYAAKSVNKKYIIENADSVALSSYIYFGLVGLVLALLASFVNETMFSRTLGNELSQPMPMFVTTIHSMSAILWPIIFVIASRRYLKAKN